MFAFSLIKLYDKGKGIGKCTSPEYKKEIIETIFKDYNEILNSENPILANREKLVGYVLLLAKYQVLILPPESESEDDPTELRGKPGITGELKAHLNEVAKKDKEIKKYLQSLEDPTENDIYDFCLMQYFKWHFFSGFFNTIRFKVNDYNPENDWYRPLVAAMCVWEEHIFRKDIGLPDVMDPDDALQYSFYMNIVLNGVQDPNLKWEESYKEFKKIDDEII